MPRLLRIWSAASLLRCSRAMRFSARFKFRARIALPCMSSMTLSWGINAPSFSAHADASIATVSASWTDPHAASLSAFSVACDSLAVKSESTD